MSAPRTPLSCPRCGAPMNRHAEKPCEPRDEAEARRADAEGIMIEETHQCPGCGCIVARRTPLGSL